MQFDWTTFILEILNFLVLLWILQRLIYRPVLAALDARQHSIQTQIDHAADLRTEAERLKSDYQARLTTWQQEREMALHDLDVEMSTLRTQALDELKQIKSVEAAKSRARDEAFAAAQQSVYLREATRDAYAQSSAMLERLASPTLTHGIVELVLEDLKLLDHDQQASLNKAAQHLISPKNLAIVSAHPLTQNHVEALITALRILTNSDLSPSVHEDDNLIAGLRITLGEYQLHANLADELAFFQRQPAHE